MSANLRQNLLETMDEAKGARMPAKRIPTLLLFGAALAAAPGSAFQAQEGRPAIQSQVTFLYYSDLAEAARFYEEALGLKATFSLEWVKIYEVTKTSSLGIVDTSRGHFKTPETRGVMFSLVTDDVDAWHARLQSRGAKILGPPKSNPETGIRAFLFQDPGGYTLEFFQWLER